VQEQLAVVVLEPGSVLCYFEPDQMLEASELRAGADVALGCVFDSFQPGGATGEVTSVLAGCRRVH